MSVCLDNGRRLQLREYLLLSEVDNSYSLVRRTVVEAHPGKNRIDIGRFQSTLSHLTSELFNIEPVRRGLTTEHSLALAVQCLLLSLDTVDFIVDTVVVSRKQGYGDLFRISNNNRF